MTYEEKKISKIVEEMTMYFFVNGADNISTHIEKSDEKVTITFKANFNPEHKSILEELDENLNCPKNDGIEDIYWELAGSGSSGEANQLLLIGMMIDQANIRMDGEFIHLEMIRIL